MNTLRKPWTTKEDKYIRDSYLTISKSIIAKTLNRTENSIKRRAHRLGLKKNEPAELWRKWEEKYLFDNFPLGQKEFIIEKLNRTWMAIRNKAKKLSIKRVARSHFVDGIKHYFFDTWSQEMAYVLGFISADGNINKSEYKLSIGLAKKDEPHLNKIKNLIAPIRNIRQSERIKNNKVFKYVHLEVCSNYMCRSLVGLGIVPKKSLILEFPDVPENFVKDFIRGNFDGDGCISQDSNSKYWQMYFLGTEKFLDTLSKHINKATGISLRNINLTKSKIHIIKYSTHDIIKICSWLHKDSTIHLERKYDKFQQLLKEREINKQDIHPGGLKCQN